MGLTLVCPGQVDLASFQHVFPGFPKSGVLQAPPCVAISTHDMHVQPTRQGLPKCVPATAWEPDVGGREAPSHVGAGSPRWGAPLQRGSRVSGVGGAPLHTKQLSDSAGPRALTTLVILKHTGLLGP